MPDAMLSTRGRLLDSRALSVTEDKANAATMKQPTMKPQHHSLKGHDPGLALTRTFPRDRRVFQ